MTELEALIWCRENLAVIIYQKDCVVLSANGKTRIGKTLIDAAYAMSGER